MQKGTSVRRTKAEWVKEIFDRELDGEYSLLDLSEKRGRPVKGRVYENTDTDLQVRQIVKEPDSQNLYRLFVLPVPGWGALPMTILTEEEYATDEALTTGFYLYNGMYTFETVNGEMRTIREFIDLRNKSFPKHPLPKE